MAKDLTQYDINDMKTQTNELVTIKWGIPSKWKDKTD